MQEEHQAQEFIFWVFFFLFLCVSLSHLDHRGTSPGGVSQIPRLAVCSAEALRRLDNWALVSSPPSSTPAEPPSSWGCCALQTRAHGKATQESYLIHRRISASVCLHSARMPACVCFCACACACVCLRSFRTPLSLAVFLFTSRWWSTFIRSPDHMMGPEACGAGWLQLRARTALATLDVV